MIKACYSIFLLLFFLPLSVVAKIITVTDSLPNSNLELNSAIDCHLTANNPFRENSTVNLNHSDAWLFFENMQPSEFIENHIDKVKIFGEDIQIETETLTQSGTEYTAQYGINCRINLYKHGTVVIPHNRNFIALKAYTDENFVGNAIDCKVQESAYILTDSELSPYNNAISSFKLKRGYMATFANNTNGTGYSRVFVADTADIEIPLLQSELDNTVSFIRVFRWQWPTKKGWCSAGNGWYNEINLTKSTWYYSWGADKITFPDQEYVPIKQFTSWPGWNEINTKANVTHLLGYNEPDHLQQANMTVSQAIEDWPNMMASGLRLGSPAVADADYSNWLRDFIRECDARNYRVDFVAVHCYWPKSVEEWYNGLKRVYETGGRRPLWITEWNNGANWTNEQWPSGTAEQEQKQLEDIETVLQLLDTCSFVERYSLYNWVEEKRALVKGTVLTNDTNNPSEVGQIMSHGTGNQFLTPAGVFYAENNSSVAYLPENDVTPKFELLKPELSGSYSLTNRNIDLSWIDYNGELSDEVILECSVNDGDFETILVMNSSEAGMRNSYSYEFINDESIRLTYRLRLNSPFSEDAVYSNEKIIEIGTVKGNTPIRYEKMGLSDAETKYFFYNEPYTEIPAVFFSSYSYNNTTFRMGYEFSGLTTTDFRFRIAPWNSEMKQLSLPEDISILVAPHGNYNWGRLPVEVGEVSNVRSDWVEVSFNQPFDDVPVVIVSPTNRNTSYPVVPRVKDITKDGFKVKLTRERSITASAPRLNVNYFAVSQGTTQIGNKNIQIGVTETEVGELAYSKTIEFGDDFSEPVFFCGLQTSNDDLTFMMRYRKLTENNVEVFKHQEISKGSGESQLDKVGWIVLENGLVSGIDNKSTAASLRVYPSVTSDFLNIEASYDAKITIFDITGVAVMTTTNVNNQIDVSHLLPGIYIVQTDRGETQKFIKRN